VAIRTLGSRYLLDEQIGQGGMGVVWRGRDKVVGTEYAIKLLRQEYAADADAVTRFVRERTVLMKFRHPAVVSVHDMIVEGDQLALVMDLVGGGDLNGYQRRSGGTLSAAETARIGAQICDGLAAAHAAGIVHRDLKPDNIFLAQSDEPADGLPYVVKLVDFGIAKIFEEAPLGGTFPMGGPTREGTVIGTPNFMAPEQLTAGGAPGPTTDLWSLGACTFAAITGRLPFEGDVIGDIVLRVCAAPMPIPSKVAPTVPPGFDAWFARACSRDPIRRFQSAEELAQALAGVCGVGRIRLATLDEDQIQYVMRAPQPTASTPGLTLPPPSMSARSALLAGLVLGVAIMVGVLGVFVWRERSQAAQQAPLAPTGAAH